MWGVGPAMLWIDVHGTGYGLQRRHVRSMWERWPAMLCRLQLHSPIHLLKWHL
jgi:hypothetical protein